MIADRGARNAFWNPEWGFHDNESADGMLSRQPTSSSLPLVQKAGNMERMSLPFTGGRSSSVVVGKTL